MRASTVPEPASGKPDSHGDCGRTLTSANGDQATRTSRIPLGPAFIAATVVMLALLALARP
ncbi:hypothetical protein [Krasilnikovia sp. M28-CT-15]|uniref:hypothetical protein n=1 Tax=Krasilnikovia sp. M28-CT-15 TaxID=3373540 RepID=UPI003875C0A0